MPSISSRPSAKRRRTPSAEATGNGGCLPGSAEYGCHTCRLSSSRSSAQSVSVSILVEGEVPLTGSAHWTEPRIGDVLKGGAGGDAPVGGALLRVIDIAAGLADPALQGLGCAHARKTTWR